MGLLFYATGFANNNGGRCLDVNSEALDRWCPLAAVWFIKLCCRCVFECGWLCGLRLFGCLGFRCHTGSTLLHLQLLLLFGNIRLGLRDLLRSRPWLFSGFCWGWLDVAFNNVNLRCEGLLWRLFHYWWIGYILAFFFFFRAKCKLRWKQAACWLLVLYRWQINHLDLSFKLQVSVSESSFWTLYWRLAAKDQIHRLQRIPLC